MSILLLPQQKLFVHEYVKDFVVAQAARRVGVTASIGHTWLAEEVVQTYLAQVMEERMLRTQIDADWVLTQLGTMFKADIAEIFGARGELLPVAEWPEAWRKMCQGIEVNELWEGNGIERMVVGQVKKARFIDRLKTLELIGKHTNVRAFLERNEITTDSDLTERLLKGRRRAQAADKPDLDFL